MKKALAVLGVTVALILTACSPRVETVSTPTPTPTPTVEAATPEQVASVLAEYEPDWREVIDAAGECRFGYVMGDEELEYASCYIREQTIVITSQLVGRDWSEMDIPASMTGLVLDTTGVLHEIGSVDLTGACGEDLFPNDSESCTSALGTLYTHYLELESQLDAWAPYL